MTAAKKLTQEEADAMQAQVDEFRREQQEQKTAEREAKLAPLKAFIDSDEYKDFTAKARQMATDYTAEPFYDSLRALASIAENLPTLAR